MRSLFWMGSSQENVKAFPEEVRRQIGFALYLAQSGEKHRDAKPLKGFGGASVLEIVEDFETDTYRAVYTVRLRSGVYVLHAFQKKSKHGIKTSKRDLDLIAQRLKEAIRYDEQRTEN
ncbi:MAG: phage-related protein [Thermomicrobiales bacterium]|jgi:phage-related protein|nr:phage-related protein [Thermomicrobiales bacterium]